MEFRTKLNIQPSPFDIGYRSRIVLLGSCFAQNIGNLLLENKFDINVNPFGIVYNPLSIVNVLKRMVNGTFFSEDEIVYHNGLYHSFLHHGDFSATSKLECLKKINASLKKAKKDISKMDVLIVTFGTSYVFRHCETDSVVSNCHKIPSSFFIRYRVTVDEIMKCWIPLIDLLQKNNPELKIIFTVSPIRHLSDGAHGNQLSKSILLLSIDELQHKFRNIYYFPSYELMIDDLRDYRFYDEDMVHPASFAIKYIWEEFCKTYFTNDTLNIIKEWQKIRKAINHRPVNSKTIDHKHFLRQTLLKAQTFKQKFPYFNCEKELNFLENQLK